MAYSEGTMSRFSLNVDDPIGRVVGRRTKAADPLAVSETEKADAEAWRQTFGGLRVAKGVYRFRSHEEADAWLWRMMARPRT